MSVIVVFLRPLGLRLSNDRTIRLCNAQNGAEAYLMGPAKAPVTSLTYSPDGEWLASGSIDNLVTLWRADGDREKIFTGHQGAVMSVAFSPSRIVAMSFCEPRS